MTIYGVIAGFLNALLAITFAVYIFLKNHRSKINQSFSSFYLFIGIWSAGYGLFHLLGIYSGDPVKTTYWVRWANFGYIPIAVLFYHFVLVFIGQSAKHKKSLIFGYLYSFFYLWLGVFPNPYFSYFVSGVSSRWYMPLWTDAGIAYYPYVIIWVLYIIYSHYLLFRHYQQSTGLRRSQCRYILLGMILGFSGGSMGYFPWFPYFKVIPPLGVALVSSCIFGAAFAVIRYRLMGIRFALGRTAVYFLTYATLLLLGLGVIYLGDFFLHSWHFLLTFRILVFLVLFAWFPKFSQFFERLGGKYFYYTAYQARKTFSQLSLELTKILNLEQLNKVIVQSFNTAFQIKQVKLYLLEDIKKDNPSLVRYLTKTVQYAGSSQQPLVAEEIPSILHQIPEERDFLLQTQRQMRNDHLELYLPLFFQQKLTGLIALGEKANQEAYTQEEIDLLSQFSYHVAVVLQNTQLYGQLEDLTQNLQARVGEQTAEIRKAYEVEKKAFEELKKLDAAKDEFILITQHHLRTPLTIMKGYLDAVLHKFQGKADPKALEYIDKVAKSTNRLTRIVNEFLDITQFQIGKGGLLKIEPVNIHNLIKEILEELQPEIEKKKLFVKINPEPKDWPLVPAEPQKLKQALFNIIDNAIKYTPAGGITVTLKKVSGRQADKVILTVEDTGIGLSPEDLKLLFVEVFERSKEAKKVFPAGRGVGLFVTARIIKIHQGRIWAESEGLGKGTKFMVEMPLSKESDFI